MDVFSVLVNIYRGVEVLGHMETLGFPGGAGGKELAFQCRRHRRGSALGSGRSPGGGHGSPLQHSCLENPLDRGACRAAVHEEVPRVGRDLATKPPPPSGMEREGALTSLLHHT